MPNAWGFNESTPGGGGVRTDQVLAKPNRQDKQEAVQPGKPLDHEAPGPRYPSPDLDRLLFLKGWLEASLKDVEEALSKIQG